MVGLSDPTVMSSEPGVSYLSDVPLLRVEVERLSRRWLNDDERPWYRTAETLGCGYGGGWNMTDGVSCRIGS